MEIKLNFPRPGGEASPGIFSHAIRYTQEGAEPAEMGAVLGNDLHSHENLIIKGDNLPALLALRPYLEGQVQLIYIDPPYNTGNESFRYHDTFSRGEWLSFLSLRLSAAKPLLSPTGAICIQIGHREMAYLKVLCDEVLGEENYVNTVTVKTATTASYRAINDCPVNVSEYILIYAADKKQLRTSPVYVEAAYTEDYSRYIENIKDPPSQWRIVPVDQKIYEMVGVPSWKEFRDRFGLLWKDKRFRMKAEYCKSHRDRVVSLNTVQKPSQKLLELLAHSRANKGQVFTYRSGGDNPMYVYNGRTLAFYSKKFREINGELAPGMILTNIWEDISFLSLGTEGGVEFCNGKKPERLIRRLIQLFAGQETDLVMDFFLGSGTTCAAAHKMGRRYVGMELLDYGSDDCVARLRNVIAGEQSGISKLAGWKGGGSFAACELEAADGLEAD